MVCQVFLYIVEFGFVQFKADYSFFTYTKGSSFIVLLVYVDDILFTGNDLGCISALKLLLDPKLA